MKMAGALRKFFGKRTPTQSLMEFASEVRELTPTDRGELRPELETALRASGDLAQDEHIED